MDSTYFRPLSVIEDYTAIGFDVDHCLTRYKIRNLSRLIYVSASEILKLTFNYPNEMFETKKNEDILNFGMSSLALDVEKGNIIKLGVSYKILRAYNGTELLNDSQIKDLYGDDMIFTDLDPLIHNRKGIRFICMSLFEPVFAILFAQAIQFKKSYEPWKNKSNQQISEELNESYDKSFVFWNYKGKTYEMQSFSLYYKDLYENIENYVYPQEDLVQLLKHLKKQGKFLFIASNSPYTYAKLTLDQSLGKEWVELFDLIVYNSGKPHFFSNDSKAELYELDLTKEKFRGPILNLENCKHAVEGNVKTLDQLIDEKTGKKGNKLFIGDNLVCDNLYCGLNPNWDSINILEELQELENGEIFGGVDYQKFWGSFFYEEKEVEKLETFWFNFVKRNCCDCYPLVLCKKFKDFIKYN